MKNLNKLHMLLLLVFFVSINSTAQNIFGPVEPNFRRWLVRSDGGEVQNNGLSPQNTLFKIGKEYGTTYRAVYQWDISDSEIPDNSIITNVRIKFSYSPINGPTYQFPSSFYTISYDIFNPDQSQLNTMWDNMNTTANEVGFLTGTNNILDFNSNNPSAPINLAIKNALPLDKFVLGVRWQEPTYISIRSWNISNSTLRLTIEYIPPQQIVTLDQRLSNNQQVGHIRKWEGANFTPYPYINPGTQFSFAVSSVQTILSEQEILSNEKYHHWNSDKTSILNHKPFFITTATNILTANFDAVYSGITIKNQIEQTSANVGSVKFKDPWLIDYADPVYGNSIRNNGIDAPFKSRVSPFYPDFSTSYGGDVYKGVFLNQGVNEFGQWVPPYYSVEATGSQYFTIPSSGRSHYLYFSGWQANPAAGAEFQNALSTSTPLVFKQDNTTISAVYKGTELSNSWSTYDNNSQRNYVRVKNSLLYSTYVSMDKLFVEEKIPNGTWTLMNSGKPITDNDVFSSSMDFINNSANEDDKLLIVVTSKTLGNYPVIYAKFLNAATETVLNSPSSSFWQSDYIHPPEDFQPVIAVNGSDKFLTVFRKIDNEYSGLYFFPGTINGNFTTFTDSLGLPWYIQGTNQYSVNPTISVSKTAANEPVYWIAWQQNSSTGSSSDIYYKQITVHTNGTFSQSGAMMSGGSGYPHNRYPTITSIGNSARVAWQGYVGFIEDGMPKENAEEMEESRVIFKSTDYWQYWQFGNNVYKPNINRHDAENGYIFAWSQSNGQGVYFANNTTLSTISTITGIQGMDVQVSNGTDKSTMTANIYKRTQQPYFFTSSAGLSGFMKEQSVRIASGREGIIRKDDVIFKYIVGDVTHNGVSIAFKEIPDTVNLNTLPVINTYLETEPFTVNSSSELLYTVGFMVTDSALALQTLTAQDEIKFNLYVVDAATGAVISTLDEVEYTKEAVGNYGNVAYQVNMAGLPQTNVKLKLAVSSNFEHISSLARRVNIGGIVEKSSKKQITLKSDLIVTDYSLSQNYPNPFNPLTQIEFALPEKSEISVRVYDILGNEIVILASGTYEPGRYSVPFDGSSYASGVYIYKLSYGKGQTITKKMTLLK